jgi:glutamate dehydrogenase/leucine dehydrogenase
VTTRKLTSTDAFVVVDLPAAPMAAGVARLAPKLLVDGAAWLARSQTYQFAAFGRKASGASAGVNAAPDARADALGAFVAELAPDVAAGTLLLEPGRGIGPDDLADLRAADPRPAEWWEQRAALRAAGFAAAAEAACGGSLDGRTVAVEGYDDTAPLVIAALTARGASIAGGDAAPAAEVLSAAADVLVIGSKAGVLDHEAVPGVQAKVVVPSGPIPVSAKALAALGRAGVVVLPDFVTTAGHLAAWPVDGAALPADLAAAAADLVATAVTPLLDHPSGPVLGACEQAEEFLLTWVDELPFGRPIG